LQTCVARASCAGGIYGSCSISPGRRAEPMTSCPVAGASDRAIT
jgi:hypothetical protein